MPLRTRIAVVCGPVMKAMNFAASSGCFERDVMFTGFDSVCTATGAPPAFFGG